jgi:hypothetical protein
MSPRLASAHFQSVAIWWRHSAASASYRMQVMPNFNQIVTLERVKGIEPSYSAWKAAALPLSYTRDFNNLSRDCAHSWPIVFTKINEVESSRSAAP